MLNRLSVVTILVRDQDEALKYYTETLGLEKIDDVPFGEGNRWLTVAAKDQKDLQIFLCPGDSFGMNLMDHVGKAPAWAFGTDNCQETYETLSARGVKFNGPPKQQPYGIEAVFKDLYGNMFSVVEEPQKSKGEG
jgi:catechol 2,3-dioxygenase-like lactoylglutathione lyase family enzyme